MSGADIVRIKIDKPCKWVTIWHADGTVSTRATSDTVGEKELEFIINAVRHNSIKTLRGETMIFKAGVNRKNRHEKQSNHDEA